MTQQTVPTSIPSRAAVEKRLDEQGLKLKTISSPVGYNAGFEMTFTAYSESEDRDVTGFVIFDAQTYVELTPVDSLITAIEKLDTLPETKVESEPPVPFEVHVNW